MDLIEEHRCFSGRQQRWRHNSSTLNCSMTFSIFLPSAKTDLMPPVLYWLSGLNCNDETFGIKSGAQRISSKLGIVLVIPDTSPRGDVVPNSDCYGLGIGASFYLNATQHPWARYYRMYDYLRDELPTLIKNKFPVSTQQAISGHSMGGHGAIVIALKNPKMFTSVSVFAPIVNPIQVPLGRKAFSYYLGTDVQNWKEWDSCMLMKSAALEYTIPILYDQGNVDEFLDELLHPKEFATVAKGKNWPLTLRIQHGYDHSYYFIASFIEDHLRFHSEYLFK